MKALYPLGAAVSGSKGAEGTFRTGAHSDGH